MVPITSSSVSRMFWRFSAEPAIDELTKRSEGLVDPHNQGS